jgi:hypothetical protein
MVSIMSITRIATFGSAPFAVGIGFHPLICHPEFKVAGEILLKLMSAFVVFD